MKIFYALLLFLGRAAASADAAVDTPQVLDPAADKDNAAASVAGTTTANQAPSAAHVIPVHVTVDCGDEWNFFDLSFEESAFIGKCLGDAFYERHAPTDGNYLADLSFEGCIDDALTTFEEREGAIDQDDGDRRRLQARRRRSASWRGSYGCEDCKRRRLLGDGGEEAEDGGATFVPSDDPELERTFVSKLKDSDTFAGIEACNIHMKYASSHIVPIKIDARCGGVDFAVASAEEKDFAGESLAIAFDEVFLKDAKSLSNMKYLGLGTPIVGHDHHDEDDEDTNDRRHLRGRPRRRGTWRGSYGCEDCMRRLLFGDGGNGEASEEEGGFLTRGGREIAKEKTRAWQDRFLAKLRTNEAFANAKTCRIRMTPP